MDQPNEYRRISNSPIARRPELAAFIERSHGTMTLAEIKAACVDHFGDKAAPSVSAISRFLLQLEASRKKAIKSL